MNHKYATASTVSVVINPRHKFTSACFFRASLIERIQTTSNPMMKPITATSNNAIGTRFESDVTLDCRTG